MVRQTGVLVGSGLINMESADSSCQVDIDSMSGHASLFVFKAFCGDLNHALELGTVDASNTTFWTKRGPTSYGDLPPQRIDPGRRPKPKKDKNHVCAEVKR